MPIATMPGGGQLAQPALRMPPGAPLPGAEGPGVPAPGEAAPQSSDVITLDEAVQALQAVQSAGRVFLVGEIVEGQTDDDLEVAVTDPSDRETIAQSLPQYQGRLSFTVVKGEPRERFVEVTAGATPEPQGDEPDLDAILAEA